MRDRVLRVIALSSGGAFPGGLIGSYLGHELLGALFGAALAAAWLIYREIESAKKDKGWNERSQGDR